MFIESPREHYFASAAWVSNTEVSVVWMNRPQNISVVTLCKSPMWYCQEVRRHNTTSRLIYNNNLKFSFYIHIISRHIRQVVMVVVGLMSFLYHTFQQMFQVILVNISNYLPSIIINLRFFPFFFLNFLYSNSTCS
jgi:hypothetical protein